MLNDFDYLIQALFADHIKTTHESHRRLQTGNCHDVRFSKFEELFKIWEELLPARKTKFDGDRISIQVPNSGASYAASEMSDGERAVFYLIGQTLLADKESALIIDEPELHLHPSIVTALWDQLAAKRPDCAFVFITHSLQFAASRSGQKFVIQSYDPTPVWELQTVDENTGFSEELTTLLLGTRRPVLFVEGAESSLDRIIYQAVYPDYLVLPCGSCDSVIHSVQSMKSNAPFTRISCSGIVDRDHRSDEEIRYLHERGVEVLPVAEIENIVLLPRVSRAIAMYEGYSGKDLESCLNDLRGKVFEKIMNTVTRDKVVARHTIRRIDSIVKGIDLTGDNSIEEIERCFQKKTAELDISQIAAEFNQTLQTAVDGNDLNNFLKHWDDKNLLALAANQLKKCQTKSFKDWLERVLVNGSVPGLTAAIRECLPKLQSAH